MSKRLVVDIGNTRCKVGIFEGRDLMDKKELDIHELKSFIQKTNLPTLLASVGEIPDLAIPAQDNIHHLTSKTPLPISVAYKSFDTLGVDRIANACATLSLQHQGSFLVVDLGTCITYDLVDENQTFVGGAITPGVDLRFKSMHNFTSKLPLAEIIEEVEFPSNSTNKNLQCGVYQGVIGEIERFINLSKKKFSDVKVVFTGGNHELFVKAFKSSTFAHPNLTLRGLNEILLFLGN